MQLHVGLGSSCCDGDMRSTVKFKSCSAAEAASYHEVLLFLTEVLTFSPMGEYSQLQ